MNKFLSHADLDYKKRIIKAKKIKSVLDTITKNKVKILDIGTGSGIIANYLSKDHIVTSVDMIDERTITENYKFILVKDEILPFLDKEFDIIISNQVIEHVNKANIHLSEIYRCLKEGGFCYLSTPNKYALFEAHYKLPFLSWLPKNLANIYMQLIKKRSYDIYPLSYNSILKLTSKFKIKNLTLDILRNQNKFNLDKEYNFYSYQDNLFLYLKILFFHLKQHLEYLNER